MGNLASARQDLKEPPSHRVLLPIVNDAMINHLMYLKILIHPYLIAQNLKESLLNDYITHTLGPDLALKLDSKVRERNLFPAR